MDSHHHQNEAETGSNDTSTNNATTHLQRNETLAKVEITVLGIILALALIGNICVMLALRYRWRKTSRLHLFILNLSVADVLVALFHILPQMAWDITGRFKGGAFLCKVVPYLQVMVIYLSTNMLIATAFDRYRAICRPLTTFRLSSKIAKTTLIIAWIVALLLAIPQFVVFKHTEISPGVFDCKSHFNPEWTIKLYATVFCCSTFFVPTLILTIIYSRICYAVCKNFGMDPNLPDVIYRPANGGIVYKFNGTGHITVLTSGKNPSATNSTNVNADSTRHAHVDTISKSKLKTVKLTFTVVLAFIVCWLPYVVSQMWWAYNDKAPVGENWFVIFSLLASLNSCCNPWIYMIFSGSMIRNALPCCRRVEKPPANRRRAGSMEHLAPNHPAVARQRADFQAQIHPAHRNDFRFHHPSPAGDLQVNPTAADRQPKLLSGSQSTKLTTDSSRSRLQKGILDKQQLACRVNGPNINWLPRELIYEDGAGQRKNPHDRAGPHPDGLRAHHDKLGKPGCHQGGKLPSV